MNEIHENMSKEKMLEIMHKNMTECNTNIDFLLDYIDALEIQNLYLKRLLKNPIDKQTKI